MILALPVMRRLLAAAVISASMFAATPAGAFWGTGEGEPTFENLRRSDYMFNPKTQKKVYDSPGWLLMTVDATDGWVQKMKLIDCRASRCMYFKRKADSRNKSVFPYEIDCGMQQVRKRWVYGGKAEWLSWGSIWAEEHKVAYNKFCR